MKICIKQLTFTKLRPFGRLRLFDFYDHVRLLEDFFGSLDDLCACCLIGSVVGAYSNASSGLDDDLMAMGDIFAYGPRSETDAIFMVFDFLRAACAHNASC